MRKESAEQDERRHPEGDDGLGIVDLVEEEVVAGFDRATEVVVHQADQNACGSQQKNDPLMGFTHVRGEIEGGQEKSRRAACENAYGCGDRNPAGEIDQ